jgi:hypothetical protein
MHAWRSRGPDSTPAALPDRSCPPPAAPKAQALDDALGYEAPARTGERGLDAIDRMWAPPRGASYPTRRAAGIPHVQEAVMTKLLTRGLVVVLIALGVTIPGGAAAERDGAISGVARDAYDRPLVGFGVRLRSLATGEVGRATTTDVRGSFGFTDAAPGSYVVELLDPTMKVVATTATLSMTEDRAAIYGVLIVPAGVVVPRVARSGLPESADTMRGAERFLSVRAGGALDPATLDGGAGVFGPSASRTMFAAQDAAIAAGIYEATRSKKQ